MYRIPEKALPTYQHAISPCQGAAGETEHEKVESSCKVSISGGILNLNSTFRTMDEHRSSTRIWSMNMRNGEEYEQRKRAR